MWEEIIFHKSTYLCVSLFLIMFFFLLEYLFLLLSIFDQGVVVVVAHKYLVDFHGYFEFHFFVCFQTIISSISSTSQRILVLVVTGLEPITFLKNDQLNQLLDN